MTIEEMSRIERELAPGEHAILAEDRDRWKRIGAGSHLDEMLAFGPGLLIIRRLAERAAYVNRPEGRAYVEKFGALMERQGYYKADGSDSTTRTMFSAILWFHDKPERLEVLRELRDAMTAGERARLNSPITARQRIEKILKERAGGTEAKDRKSPVALLRQQIAEKDREIAALKAKLGRRDDGSLFDLQNDTLHDIGQVVAANVSQSRAIGIGEAIIKAAKAKGRKPAG
jgi:hypothetical protein